MSDRWVDELMPDQPMWVRDLVDEELRRKEAEAERLTNKLNTDSQNFEIECLKAEVEMVRAEVERLTDQRDWHQRRNYALQKAQRHMRDPERKVVCDILANGTTYVEPFRAALAGEGERDEPITV